MEKTGMLVRKLPVKLALETMQADGLNRAGVSQSSCVCVCVSVCGVSIYQSVHNVHVCV